MKRNILLGQKKNYYTTVQITKKNILGMMINAFPPKRQTKSENVERKKVKKKRKKEKKKEIKKEGRKEERKERRGPKRPSPHAA